MERTLVVGGTGEVGRRISKRLDPGAVVIGGRHEGGDGVRRVDVTDPESIEAALDGVSTVVACVRQPEPHLLRAVVRRGLAYTSIAPPWLSWEALRPLHDEARGTGARVIYATGLEPGISSVLARVGADRLGTVDSVETALLLGVGDAYGADSLAFLIEELSQRYEVLVGGRPVPSLAFGGAVPVEFPAPFGRRHAHPMPFRDQLFYPHTLGATTSVARMSLDPAWVDRVVTALVRAGRPLLRGGPSRGLFHGFARWLKARYADADRFALVVQVRGPGRTVRATVTGRQQAEATAIGAAATVDALPDVPPGVWLAEQVVPPGPFLARLASAGLAPTIEES